MTRRKKVLEIGNDLYTSNKDSARTCLLRLIRSNAVDIEDVLESCIDVMSEEDCEWVLETVSSGEIEESYIYDGDIDNEGLLDFFRKDKGEEFNKEEFLDQAEDMLEDFKSRSRISSFDPEDITVKKDGVILKFGIGAALTISYSKERSGKNKGKIVPRYFVSGEDVRKGDSNELDLADMKFKRSDLDAIIRILNEQKKKYDERMKEKRDKAVISKSKRSGQEQDWFDARKNSYSSSWI